MSDDAYSLTERSIRELRRMLQTQQSEMINLRRRIARVDVPRQIYKPSEKLKWFHLQGNAYPQSDLSPYDSSVWETTGKEMEWDDDEKQWILVDPPVEETIYSTGCIYAMKDRVVPCQQAMGGGYEIVSSDPPDACYFEAQNMSSFGTQGDLTGLSPSGYGFEEASGVNTTKSGFLFLTHTFNRGYEPTGSQYVRAIEYQDATAPSTNGTFDVNFTGIWEIDIHVWGEIRIYYTGGGSNPRHNAISRTTGAASAGTAHTHSYNEYDYLNGNDPAPALQAVIWTKPSGGSYAEYTGLDMPVEHFPFATTSGVVRRNYSYRVRQACNLMEGDRLGIQLVSADLYACQMRMEGATVCFRLVMPGNANQITA